MLCPFQWPGPAWGGQMWLRRFVVAAPEEKTGDYGIHNRRHEYCITLGKRGPESPKPFLLHFQNSSWLLPRTIPAAPGVWTGIEPRSEWQAALCWWKVCRKAFEMPLLGVLSFPPTEPVLSFRGYKEELSASSEKSLQVSLQLRLQIRQSDSGLQYSQCMACHPCGYGNPICSCVSEHNTHIPSHVFWSGCCRWGRQLRWLATFHY